VIHQGQVCVDPIELDTLQIATSSTCVPGSKYGSLHDNPVLLVGVRQSISLLHVRTQMCSVAPDHASEQNEPVGHPALPVAVHGATHCPVPMPHVPHSAPPLHGWLSSQAIPRFSSAGGELVPQPSAPMRSVVNAKVSNARCADMPAT
jgi:hypothetical protein